jgi:hypothetical protein
MLLQVHFTYPEDGKINPTCHVVTRPPYAGPSPSTTKLRSELRLDGSNIDAMPLTADEKTAVLEQVAAASAGKLVWQPPDV